MGWPLLTWLYQIIFSIFVSLAEVQPMAFTVLILLLNMLRCFFAWRWHPFNSKFNSILETILSGLTAAFSIVAIVGATDTSKTEEAANIVFYIFMGIGVTFTLALFIYDQTCVSHIKDITLPFRETLPKGPVRQCFECCHDCGQGVTECCQATCTCCMCGKGRTCPCCDKEEDIHVTVSPADWRSIQDMESNGTNLADSVELPLSHFKMLMGKIIHAVEGYMNHKTFKVAALLFLDMVITQTLSTAWHFPAAFARNRERLELVC
jgi:hypothetical protein